MNQQPTLETKRLVLRPFTLADAADVQRLAGDRAIAATTEGIPHPYEDGIAEEWISGHQEQYEKGNAIHFAVVLHSDNSLIGTIALTVRQSAQQALLGYWIGKPHWGQGYCTEAAEVVVEYGFEVLELNRIHSCHFGGNPASGRVMQKIGMTYEGCRRQHFCKWGEFEDCVDYAILRSEYEAQEE